MNIISIIPAYLMVMMLAFLCWLFQEKVVRLVSIVLYYFIYSFNALTDIMESIAEYYISDNLIRSSFISPEYLMRQYDSGTLSWRTYKGEYIPVSKMTSAHIINTKNMLSDTMESDTESYIWCKIFDIELQKRNL